MQKRFPDLICIGAQKAATTWLHEMLRHREQFYLPALKELHYFTQVHQPEIHYPRNHRARWAARVKERMAASPNKDREGFQRRLAEVDLLGRAEVDDDWYASIFAQALPEQICVEVCPSYLHLPEAGVQHILRLNPSVKLLLFVRDPVDRAWSQIRMNLAHGQIANQDAVLSGKWIKAYLANSEYRDSITLWRSLVARGQLQIVSYDEVASDPVAVISRVCKMVGVAPFDDIHVAKRVVHQGKEFDFPKTLRVKLLSKLLDQYKFLETEFPDLVPKWLAKHEATWRA